MLFFCRFTSETLRSKATSHLKGIRSSTMPTSAAFLVTDKNMEWGDKHTQINKRSISRSLAPLPQDKVINDEENMMLFIENSSLKDVVIPVIHSIEKTIPNAIPILDLVRAHCDKNDVWKYPHRSELKRWSDNRGYDLSLSTSVLTKEIVIGSTPPAEVEEISNWALKMFHDSESVSPIGVLPMNVQYTTISLYDLLRLGRSELYGKEFKLEQRLNPAKDYEEDWFRDKEGKIKNNKWVKFPAKIMWGNGLDWALILSFNVIEYETYQTCIPGKFQTSLLQFFHQLPTITGFKIKTHVSAVEVTLSLVAGCAVRLPFFIDIQSLAVLSGWKMSSVSIETLVLVTLGTPTNRLVTDGDSRWGVRFEDISPALKVFLVGELKNLYLVYSTFLLAIREEVLTDPDIWGFLTSHLQREILVWWAEYITYTLRGVFVDRKELVKAESRRELLAALHAIKHDGTKLDASPYRVSIMATLLDSAVSLSAGGARFLHIERERAMLKYQIFAAMPIQGKEAFFSRRLTDADVLYARFGQSNISSLNPGFPVNRGSDRYFLTLHRALPLPKLEFSPRGITIQTLLEVFKQLNRSQTEALLEWGRTNVHLVESFFEACVRNSLFSKKYRAVYEPLRMIVLRTLNRHSIEVPACEQNFERYQNEALRALAAQVRQLEDDLRTLQVEKEDLEQELVDLKERIGKGKLIDRSEWRGPAQPLPRSQRTPGAHPPQPRGQAIGGAVGGVDIVRPEGPPDAGAMFPGAAPFVEVPGRGAEPAGTFNPWFDPDEDPESGRTRYEATLLDSCKAVVSESRVIIQYDL